MIRLSTTSKLDGIKSWSLQAVETCPGAHDGHGGLVQICRGCYARSGNYRFPAVKNTRHHNKIDWMRDAWVDDMVKALDNERYFRWFDSGDIYVVPLAEKIFQVIQKTPWCHHWLPTRSHKFEKFALVLKRIAELPNAAVRFSADVFDTFDPAIHGSVVISDPDNPPASAKVCRAYENQPSQCNGCRDCWDQRIATIGYPVHGRVAERVMKQQKRLKAA